MHISPWFDDPSKFHKMQSLLTGAVIARRGGGGGRGSIRENIWMV